VIARSSRCPSPKCGGDPQHVVRFLEYFSDRMHFPISSSCGSACCVFQICAPSLERFLLIPIMQIVFSRKGQHYHRGCEHGYSNRRYQGVVKTYGELPRHFFFIRANRYLQEISTPDGVGFLTTHDRVLYGLGVAGVRLDMGSSRTMRLKNSNLARYSRHPNCSQRDTGESQESELIRREHMPRVLGRLLI